MRTSAVAARIIAHTPLSTKVAVAKIFDVAEAVNAALTRINQPPQWLAEQADINLEQLAGWLGGMHPLTLDEVARLEAALQADLLVTRERPQGYFGHTSTIQNMSGFNALIKENRIEVASQQNFLRVSVQTATGEQRYYSFAA